MTPSRASFFVALGTGVVALLNPTADGNTRTPDRQERVAPALRPASGPGERSLDLQYFRLQPSPPDTVYRLLVIPVQFPENDDLGVKRDSLEKALNGTGLGSLRGYYLAATGGRLRVECTLAPVVVANHARSYYTSEGDGNLGYGLDPDAYPHNARFLVEEVTGKIVYDVDFKHFDNTGDGIADGLLIVHSGPRAPEIPAQTPRDYLLAHAFTLDVPVDRGGAWVFPYAVVAVREPVGPYAHEVGHLLGLTDLYVANGFCPGPGVGDWSLMATGANRDGGRDPSGLDPFSRQLLGLPATFVVGEAVDLSGGAFLRVFRPGKEKGPRYFLVERRTGDDGLGLDTEMSVVYYVDEDAGDNRSCVGPSLVEVRAEVCAGAGPCSVRLDDFSNPNLNDGDDAPTHLVLEFDADGVFARHEALPMVRLERIRLLPPTSPPQPPEEQPIEVTVRNFDLGASRAATMDIAPLDPGVVCVALNDTVWDRILAPGATLVDTAWTLVACSPGSPLPGANEVFTVSLAETGTFFTRTDTVVLAANQVGLAEGNLPSFSTRNLNPGRANPWSQNGDIWEAGDLDRFADAELLSPWFSVPAAGRLVVDHSWDLNTLSPDVVLDGGQFRVRRLLHSDVLLTPQRGWGYTAERKTGNALAGQELLGGTGSRTHVFDVSDYEGEVVRLVIRIAGDVDPGGATWTVTDASARAAPAVGFTLHQDGRALYAETASAPESGVTLVLYQGPTAVAPTEELTRVAWDGGPRVSLGTSSVTEGRFELLWETMTGEADTYTDVFSFPTPVAAGAFLQPVFPNPVSKGVPQTWTILAGDNVPSGFYRFYLTDLSGRLIWALDRRVDVAGLRTVRWDGRDGAGRQVPAGVYFLQVLRPDGKTDRERVVVIP